MSQIVNTPQSVHTAPKLKLYVKLQYYGPQSYNIRNNLLKFLQPAYPQIDFRFVFTNSFSIRRLFPFKDRIPNVLKSNVIYEYSCFSCEAKYIGQTTRCLYSRICEHKGISDRFKTTTHLASPLSLPSDNTRNKMTIKYTTTISNSLTRHLTHTPSPS